MNGESKQLNNFIERLFILRTDGLLTWVIRKIIRLVAVENHFLMMEMEKNNTDFLMRVYLIFLLHKWILCTEKAANFDRDDGNWFYYWWLLEPAFSFQFLFWNFQLKMTSIFMMNWEKEPRHKVHKTD